MEAIPAVRDAGFDLVSLANNHAGDYGPGRVTLIVVGIHGIPADAGRNAGRKIQTCLVGARLLTRTFGMRQAGRGV